MEKMKVDVVETKPCLVTLGVEIPGTDVSDETVKVWAEIQRTAQVPGFRPGKAPLDMIKKKYQSTAREMTAENLIKKSLMEALKQKNLEPVGFPSVEKVEFDFEKPLKYTIKAELHPEFKVKDYKGIKIKKDIHPITEKKINENLDNIRERNSQLVEAKSDKITKEHLVMVDYDGYLGTEQIPGMKTRNHMIDLSAPQVLANFKEGLVGASKGETKDINVKFPKEHPDKKLAEKEVTFKVKVNEIKEKKLPELNDDMAKDIGLKDLKDLKEKIRENLEREEKVRQDREVEKQLIDQLLDKNVFGLPQSLVLEQEGHLVERAAEYFRQQGLTDESAVKKNLEDYRPKYHAEAEKNIRLSYILNAIAKEENITVSDEDIKAETDKLMKANTGREKEVEKYCVENRDRLYAQIKEEKIFKFLLESAKIKETKA